MRGENCKKDKGSISLHKSSCIVSVSVEVLNDLLMVPDEGLSAARAQLDLVCTPDPNNPITMAGTFN